MAKQRDQPVPKSNVGQLVIARLKEFVSYSAVAAEATLGLRQTTWYRPSDLVTALSDSEKISDSFSRKQQDTEFDAVVSDADKAGTIGDLIVLQSQGDLMACMERAFRVRNQSSCRSRCQPAGRLAGHGGDLGPVALGMLGYLQGIDRMNKGDDVPGDGGSQ